jgi:hypothetical protein
MWIYFICRYGLLDMKNLCENMLIPSKDNWLDLLRAGDVLQAHTLRRNVLAYLRDHFDALQKLHQIPVDDPTQDEDDEDGEYDGAKKGKQVNQQLTRSMMQEFQEEFPQLLEHLLFSRTITFPLPPNQQLIERTRQSQQQAIESEQTTFPFYALVLAFISTFIYSQMTTVVSFGWLVPAVNISLVMGGLLYGIIVVYKEIYGNKGLLSVTGSVVTNRFWKLGQ